MSINLKTLLSAELTAYYDADHLSKKKILECIGKLACEFDQEVKCADLLEALQQRERLGSTAIGNKIAIPHARIAGLTQPICVVVLLHKAVAFDPEDEDTAQVDLIFSLLVPEKKDALHLDMLAALAEKLKDEQFTTRLRQSKTSEALYHNLMSLL